MADMPDTTIHETSEVLRQNSLTTFFTNGGAAPGNQEKECIELRRGFKSGLHV
jgi:hypothetical protein